MLRSLLIYLSRASWARALVMRWSFAWRAASRFIAGTRLEDALRVVGGLNSRGINATLDHLGEHTTTEEEAIAAADAICQILDALETSGACANVSIKLTQVGLALSEELCARNLRRIVSHARDRGNFVRIDIEDTPYTDKTFRLFEQLRAQGLDNCGVALQSYLYRSESDAQTLLKDQTRVRLVKGAYQEPADKAFPKKRDVDSNFDLLARLLLEASLAADSRLSADCRVPPIPAIATHDAQRIEFCRRYADQIGLPKNGLEFQMLYGIRRDLQERLSGLGYPVRVYVPFGEHWYPYYMRRLAERPANIWFFATNLFRR